MTYILFEVKNSEIFILELKMCKFQISDKIIAKLRLIVVSLLQSLNFAEANFGSYYKHFLCLATAISKWYMYYLFKMLATFQILDLPLWSGGGQTKNVLAIATEICFSEI